MEGKLFEIYRPLPIKLTLKLSIVTKYITDLYQIYGAIASKFSCEHNFISWYIPYKTDKFRIEELRSKVSWSDLGLNITEREKIQESDEDRFVGDMSFDIEGWLFPEAIGDESVIIKDIGTSTILSNELLSRINVLENEQLNMPLISKVLDYNKTIDNEHNKVKYLKPKEWASNRPFIVNVFMTKKFRESGQLNMVLDKKRLDFIKQFSNYDLIIDGYNFNDSKALLVTPDNDCSVTIQYDKRYESEESNTAPPAYDADNINYLERKSSTLSGYPLECEIINDNLMLVKLKSVSDLENITNFDIAVYNKDDYSLVGTCLDKMFPFSKPS